jgi:hypothetical protein
MENLDDILSNKYFVISVMGPYAGESERAIFERKIDDIHRIGRTFWLIRSHRAKPLMVQRLLGEAGKKELVATAFLLSLLRKEAQSMP